MYILKQVSHKYDKCCSKNRTNLCKQTALATNNNDDKMHPIWYSQLKTHNYNNKTKESEREGGRLKECTFKSYGNKLFRLRLCLRFASHFVLCDATLVLFASSFGFCFWQDAAAHTHNSFLHSQKPNALPFYTYCSEIFVYSLDRHHGYSMWLQNYTIYLLLIFARDCPSWFDVCACAVPSIP